MGLDVFGDGWGEQAGTWISGMQAVAEFGGGDSSWTVVSRWMRARWAA